MYDKDSKEKVEMYLPDAGSADTKLQTVKKVLSPEKQHCFPEGITFVTQKESKTKSFEQIVTQYKDAKSSEDVKVTTRQDNQMKIVNNAKNSQFIQKFMPKKKEDKDE